MYHQLETLIGEDLEVAHIALDRFDREALALGYQSILSELSRGVIEHGHPRARGGKHGRLLATGPCETKCSDALERRKPIPRDSSTGGQDNFPVPAPSRLHNLGADWNGPLVTTLDESIPSLLVVLHNLHGVLTRCPCGSTAPDVAVVIPCLAYSCYTAADLEAKLLAFKTYSGISGSRVRTCACATVSARAQHRARILSHYILPADYCQLELLFDVQRACA